MVNSKTKFSFIFLFAFVFALSIVSAQTDFGYNNLDLPTLSKTVINYTQTNVNSSDFWDDLDTPADIFFADLSSSSFTLASGDSISFDYLTTGLQNLYKAEILHSIVDNAGVDVLLIDDGVAFTRSLVASNGYHMLDFSTMGFADFIDNDINTTGDVHANTYYGNGSQLTGIESGWDGNITAPNGKNLSLNKVDTNSLSTIKDNVLSVAASGKALDMQASAATILDIPWNNAYDTTIGSISFWFKSNTNAAQEMFIAKAAAFGDFFSIALEADGTIKIWTINDLTSSARFSTTSGLDDGEWHHIVVTGNSSEVKLYLDGSEDTLTGGFGNLLGWFGDIDTPNQIYAGYDGGRLGLARFDGQIDEINLFNTLLDSTNVTALWNSGIGKFGTSSDAGLIGGFHLDEGTGNIASDFSTTSNDASGTGLVWTTGIIAPLGEAKEIIVLQSRDGISAGEFGAVELGDDDVRLSLNGKSIYQYLDGVIKYLLDTTGFHFYDDVEIIGDANITGDLIVQGSTTTLENVIVGGNFTAKRPYGMFSSAESHIAIAADTVYAINFSHIEDNYLMSLEGAENITIQQSGDYLIELSVIVVTDANNKHFDIFPQTTHGDGVTFVNVPRSNTKISIENAGTEQVIAVPFILDLNAGDKFRIMYASDAAGSMTVASVEHGAGVNAVPATPSIIMTASKISEITD